MKKNTMYLIPVLLLLFNLLLTSCASEEKSSGTKIIEKENLYELIIKDGQLIPGDGLEWYMSKADFLESDYYSDKLNPDSAEFEVHRISNSEDGTTGIYPDIGVKLKEYNITTADTTYLFDEHDKLIMARYLILCPSDSIDEYSDILNNLCEAAEGFDELLPTDTDFRSFTDENLLENPIIIKWHHASEPVSFQINSINFQNNLMMDLILSVDD